MKNPIESTGAKTSLIGIPTAITGLLHGVGVDIPEEVFVFGSMIVGNALLFIGGVWGLPAGVIERFSDATDIEIPPQSHGGGYPEGR